MILSAALLAISLSVDALGVGIAYGLRKINIPLISKIIICFFSIFYSSAALAAGKTLSYVVSPYISKFIGIAILVFMGVWIIIQAMIKHENSNIPGSNRVAWDEPLIKIVIKSLGITI